MQKVGYVLFLLLIIAIAFFCDSRGSNICGRIDQIREEAMDVESTSFSRHLAEKTFSRVCFILSIHF